MYLASTTFTEGISKVKIQVFRSRRATLLVGVIIATFVALGMLSQSGDKPKPIRRIISLSMAKEYKNLGELRADASVVALVTVEGSPTPSSRLGDTPTVDLQLRVEKVIGGSAKIGDAITLVQVGDPSGRIIVADPVPPILQTGVRYIVYLNRQFPDQPQMFLTGQAGVFAASTGSNFQRLGDTSVDLPKIVTLDQLSALH